MTKAQASEPGRAVGKAAPRATPRRTVVAVGALILLAGCEDEAPVAGPGVGTPQRLPTATIRVGDVPLEVEVADTQEERHKGMMFRRRLEPDEAMLFVFPGERDLAFHMRNTYVDLDLAYIAADGRIIEITRLYAHRRAPVRSREPARFALEVPAGWFADRGIAEGDPVTIPPEVTEGPAEPRP
jgi:hypothetical protein